MNEDDTKLGIRFLDENSQIKLQIRLFQGSLSDHENMLFLALGYSQEEQSIAVDHDLDLEAAKELLLQLQNAIFAAENFSG